MGSVEGTPDVVAGLEALAAADVVVTDRLGATPLLERLPDDVEVVDVAQMLLAAVKRRDDGQPAEPDAVEPEPSPDPEPQPVA